MRTCFTGLSILMGSLALAGGVMLAQEDTTLPVPDLSNPAAPFIYSHDFAIAAGATAEWHQMEGVALDVAHRKLYLAVTNIRHDMTDEKGDLRLRKNRCGAIFEGTLDTNFNLTALHE